MRFVVFSAVLASLSGCSPTVGSDRQCAAAEPPIPAGTIPVVPRCPGECDDAAARTLVYDASGLPLYAGQALLLQTCSGSGSYCHATDASDRFGAPGEMNFDMLPIPTMEPAPGELETLTLTHQLVNEQRNLIWAQVVSGAMPPGEAGRAHFAADFGYVVDPLDVEADVVLAQLDTAEGREILRNWLACGAPIVERTTTYLPSTCTTDRDCATARCEDGECRPVGDIWPMLDRTPAP